MIGRSGVYYLRYRDISGVLRTPTALERNVAETARQQIDTDVEDESHGSDGSNCFDGSMSNRHIL